MSRSGHPEHAALIQRVLAIPPTRFDRTTGAAHMTVSALSGCLVPVSWLTMTPRIIIISSTSRELSGNRWSWSSDGAHQAALPEDLPGAHPTTPQQLDSTVEEAIDALSDNA
ncbi:MAG: hypothetical protein WCF33_00665 [Pseudonocardiaceae bacterium]